MSYLFVLLLVSHGVAIMLLVIILVCIL